MIPPWLKQGDIVLFADNIYRLEVITANGYLGLNKGDNDRHLAQPELVKKVWESELDKLSLEQKVDYVMIKRGWIE